MPPKKGIKKWAKEFVAITDEQIADAKRDSLMPADICKVIRLKPGLQISPLHDDITYDEDDLVWNVDPSSVGSDDIVLIVRDPSDQPVVVGILNGNDPDPIVHPEGKKLKKRVDALWAQAKGYKAPVEDSATLTTIDTDEHGSVRYAVTDNAFYGFNRNTMTWSAVGGGGGGGPTALDDLTDVVITSPATNATLLYNGAAWVDGLVTNATVDPSAAIAYSKLNLTGSIVNADVNASAAIAYSKLNLTTSIVNGDVAAAAAIAVTKLANAGAGAIRLLGTNASNVNVFDSLSGWGIAPLASPALTGTPTAPTAAVDTNTTQIATTAFVVGQASSTNPLMNGSVAVGTSLRYAREDHVHATDTSLIAKTTLTTKGDILVRDGTAPTRLAVGTNTYYLTANSATSTGLEWVAFPTLVTTLDGLSDVVITSPATGHILRYDGADWVNAKLVNADVDAAAAIAYSKLNLATSIVNADISGSAAIAYSKLNLSGGIVNADVNASAAIAYSKLNLATSIVNADISGSAAIAYSKLNLATSIVDADVAAAAAIAVSKLANAGAGAVRLLGTNASNVNVFDSLSGWGIAADSAVVHIAGTETITGDKETTAHFEVSGSGKSLFVNTNANLRIAGRLWLNETVHTTTGSISGSRAKHAYTGTGGHTITLPTITSVGLTIFFENRGSATVDLARASSNTITLDSATGLTSVTVAPGEALMLHHDGADPWTAVWMGGRKPSLLATLASPTFTGTPVAPTAAVDTNTTQLATTAFVVGQASSTNPVMNGAVAVGTSLRYAREDHVHATDTSLVAKSTLTTKGDIFVRDGTGVIRLAVGTDTYVLSANSATASGLEWVAPGTPSAHASTHIRGGSDIIDGDRVVISWNPTYYTPDSAPSEAGHVDDLTAHLAGVDTLLGLKAPIASPTFTGTATIPTLAVTGTSSFANDVTVNDSDLILNGPAATNGSSAHSPFLILRGYYDSDPGAGTTSTAVDITVKNFVTASGVGTFHVERTDGTDLFQISTAGLTSFPLATTSGGGLYIGGGPILYNNGGSLTTTAAIAMGTNKITGLGLATASTDAASLANKVHEFAAPTAALAMNSQKITGLAAGTTNGDALRYEQLIGAYLPIGGGTLTGSLTISNNGGATTLNLSNTTAGVGLTIGGDVTLYRSAADILKTDDDFRAVDAMMGVISSVNAVWAHSSNYNLTDYALLQTNNGDTVVNGKVARTVYFRINNAEVAKYTGAAFAFSTGVRYNLESTKTSAYTIAAGDYIIPVDSTGGVFTVTLPASHTAGDTYKVKDVGGEADGNRVKIDTSDSDTIDGRNEYFLDNKYQVATFTSDGTNWMVM